MSYSVKEIFFSIQGEGANAGKAAVFCRFAGCNLWTGHEQDRATATCRFCDTDFVGTSGEGGGTFSSPASLADEISRFWSGDQASRFVVLTGGEPMLQVDDGLIRELHLRGFVIAVETNGTIDTPRSIDWICVSPKASAKLVVQAGEELKLIYPQAGAEPERYAGLRFDHFFLQPMDAADRADNTQRALEYCLLHPQWRLSVQVHKFIGVR